MITSGGKLVGTFDGLGALGAPVALRPPMGSGFNGGTTTFRQFAPPGQGMEVNFDAGGINGTVLNPGSQLVLDSTNGNGVGLVIKNGKTFLNLSGVTLNGASYIKLPNEGGYATLQNTNQGTVTINSIANWSFLSDSGVQGGVINNAGVVQVLLPATASTSWEALFHQLPGGTLVIAPGKSVSAQNVGNVQGTITLGVGSELRISEQHGGLRTLAGNFSSA